MVEVQQSQCRIAVQIRHSTTSSSTVFQSLQPFSEPDDGNFDTSFLAVLNFHRAVTPTTEGCRQDRDNIRTSTSGAPYRQIESPRLAQRHVESERAYGKVDEVSSGIRPPRVRERQALQGVLKTHQGPQLPRLRFQRGTPARRTGLDRPGNPLRHHCVWKHTGEGRGYAG